VHQVQLGLVVFACTCKHSQTTQTTQTTQLGLARSSCTRCTLFQVKHLAHRLARIMWHYVAGIWVRYSARYCCEYVGFTLILAACGCVAACWRGGGGRAETTGMRKRRGHNQFFMYKFFAT
jgi:hypothetical protein